MRKFCLVLVLLFIIHLQGSSSNNLNPKPTFLCKDRSVEQSPIESFDPSQQQKMQYNALLRKLYNINLLNPVKMGLDNAERLYKLFGKPVNGIPTVHVAGTNGKGSVTLKIAQSLKLGGVRTGLFVSPHISSFRERIQVNGTSMSEETVVTMLPQLFAMCEKHSIPATFFELTSTMAFVAFKQANCEAIVVEVGLGGRLDSTNIITPTLSIITSIQLDHVKILGDTIEKIAAEKAGIMKPGVDVLVGPGCPVEFLRAEALRVGAPFYTLDDVLTEGERAYKAPRNKGDFSDIDDLNKDIAKAALRLLERKNIPGLMKCFRTPGIEDGLSVRPSCRFESFRQKVTVHATNTDSNNSTQFKVKNGSAVSDYKTEELEVEVEVILDIAHNEDAMIALVSKIKSLYPDRNLRVVLGMSADKDLEKCLAPVLDMVCGQTDRIHCVAARQSRALSALDLKNLLEEYVTGDTANNALGMRNSLGGSSKDSGVVCGTVRSSVRLAIDSVALEHARHRESGSKVPVPLVVVCGTAFIMAECRAELGVLEPKDSDSLSDPTAADNDNIDAQEFFGNPTSPST